MEKKKILIVDDEVDLAYLVKTRLELDKYHVVPCYTSKRALEIAIREKPDAILLDIMMPDLDGYQVCRLLRDDKRTRQIPIILFTAKEIEAGRIKDKCREVGADDYIFKPYEFKELLNKIDNITKIGRHKSAALDYSD